MPSFIVLALTGLPLLGVLVASALLQWPRARAFAWLALPLSATLALVAAWGAHSLSFEMTFGDWGPMSVTGAPLILASSPPATTIIIAVAVAQLVASLHPREAGVRPDHTTSALLFGALTLAALSNNLLTLIVSIGLVDILSVIAGIQRGRDHRRVIADAMFRGASLALLVIALALYLSIGNSLYLPLAVLPERLMPFITLSLALRFGLAPLRAVAGQFHDAHWTSEAGAISGLIVLTGLPLLSAPALPAWFYGLALLTVVLTGLIGAITRRRTMLRLAISSSALGLVICSAALQQPGVTAVATLSWLVGNQLVALSPREDSAIGRQTALTGRLIGSLCLIGLPLTAGFIARAGVAALWADDGPGGALLIAGFALGQALLTLSVLRITFAPTGITAYSITLPSAGSLSLSVALSIFAIAIPGVHVLAFGVAPALAGAPDLADALGGHGVSGWLAWVLPLAIAAGAWWLESRWAGLFAPARQRIYDVIGLGWLHTILDGAISRLGLPLSRVFPVLEGGSALLWTIVIVLIVVLVNRPGGP